MTTLDRVTYIPFPVGEQQTFDRITAHVTVAGAAGAVIRLGIYASVDALPGALVVDAGTVATDTTGHKEITISETLNAGELYWLAHVSQVATCTSRAQPIGSGALWIGGALATDGRTANFIETGITGALPANATPAVGSVQCPLSKLRAA